MYILIIPNFVESDHAAGGNDSDVEGNTHYVHSGIAGAKKSCDGVCSSMDKFILKKSW